MDRRLAVDEVKYPNSRQILREQKNLAGRTLKPGVSFKQHTKMEFDFINQSEMSLALFEKHPAWAVYSEPEDINHIENWGIDRKTINQKLEAVGYSDDYIFPILKLDDLIQFKFHYYKAVLTTPTGRVLNGYTVGKSFYAVGVFTKSKLFVLNLNLPDLAIRDEIKILKDIGATNESLFPLSIEIDIKNINISGIFHPKQASTS